MLGLIEEGGYFFMLPIIFLLVTVVVILVRAFVRISFQEKAIQLVGSLALFTLAWGFLGQIIGLIGAFDSIEFAGGISPDILAAGLKVSFLPPVFGLLTFLIGRMGIIILSLRDGLKKSND